MHYSFFKHKGSMEKNPGFKRGRHKRRSGSKLFSGGTTIFVPSYRFIAGLNKHNNNS